MEILKIGASLEEWREVALRLTNERLESVCDEVGLECPPRLSEAMRYALLAPGKRFRPLLVFLGAGATGGVFSNARLEDTLLAACAIEMIHTYSLIHDDLPSMDDDDLRRGRPTCHKKFDEATAILAGDALQTLAFETILKITPSRATRCGRILSRAAGAFGMVGGQMDDVAFREEARRPILPLGILHGLFEDLSREFQEVRSNVLLNSSFDVDLVPLESMQDRKTGALIAAALMMGATVGDATEEQIFRLGLFGQYLGLMFQITDDLLDATSTVEEMGKQVQKDDDKGKITWPARLGLEPSRRYVQTLRELAIAETPGELFANREALSQLLDYVCERKK
ncbi:MAG: polyprenyl synthetase family protein [Planctomycetia bacterium]|nr:polyprenyl synthetase family protein [Planctomycetia bacterium]